MTKFVRVLPLVNVVPAVLANVVLANVVPVRETAGVGLRAVVLLLGAVRMLAGSKVERAQVAKVAVRVNGVVAVPMGGADLRGLVGLPILSVSSSMRWNLTRIRMAN